MARKAMLLTALVLTVAALTPAAALAKAGGTDRPVKGTVVGDVTVPIPSLQLTTDASGVMTHLGKYTAHFEGSAEIVGSPARSCAAAAPFETAAPNRTMRSALARKG